MSPSSGIVQALQNRAIAFDDAKGLDPLIETLSKSRVVILGEASHGTHEFYEWRRVISEALIERGGFNFIAVEGDWPACLRMHRFLTEEKNDPRALHEVLEASFRNWPQWMWANQGLKTLFENLRERNVRLPEERRVGFYGLDLYSMFESIDEVRRWLRNSLEPANGFLARRISGFYGCFEPFHGNPEEYSRFLHHDSRGCEDPAIAALLELLQIRIDGSPEQQFALFDAQQNGRVIRSAERYYRKRALDPDRAWNVRDHHMMETLMLLVNRYGMNGRAIVWCHNNHAGDSRGIGLEPKDFVTLGGLARDLFGAGQVSLVGFGTQRGQVIAADRWEGVPRVQALPPAQRDSYENALHQVCVRKRCKQLFLTLDRGAREEDLAEVLDVRAVGVVHDPDDERTDYLPTSLANRYDAFVFIDETRALEPLTLPSVPRAPRHAPARGSSS